MIESRPRLTRVALAAAAAASALAVSSGAFAELPTIPASVTTAATAIASDAPMKAMLEELTSPEAQEWRFDTLLELARIASPSRSEMRRQAEITKRLVEEWGFAPEDIMTTPEGVIRELP